MLHFLLVLLIRATDSVLIILLSPFKGILNWHKFLSGPEGAENARFGSAITALSDINMDGFNDVIVGSPLENQNTGAVYIYNGHERTIRLKYSQVILEFHSVAFGCIIVLLYKQTI